MKQKIFIPLILLILLSPINLSATVEYSRKTGKNCTACHISPSGGRDLTAEGEAFRNDLRLKGLYKPLTTAQHVVRLIVGYLHSMTAIMWFGAILYVHILLKPAYASRGLPRGELFLGWLSIFIMAVTGTLLTIARVPSWNMLLQSRFGILLIIKILLFLVMVATATVVTFIIGPRMKRRSRLKVEQHKQDLPPEELSQFDGKDGRPAYIAYNGNIYDVSQSRLWKNGSHAKKHLAGFDLTDALKQAPHGEEKVLGMPRVGTLIPARAQNGKPLYERVFYFLAYMNLAIVFIIVLIISLWRWW